MSAAQEVSDLYTTIYCYIAALALLVYDWLLCFGMEVQFMWNWHSGITIPFMVYSMSRYVLLIQTSLIVATSYPMSDKSCLEISWAQTVSEILGVIAFSAFSALRGYALSDRNVWLTMIIVLSAVPPWVILVIGSVFQHSVNLPSPFNCSDASSLSPPLENSLVIIFRGSQLAGELLVIGITWWYTYQSYRIQKGVTLGKTLGSLLLYNGTFYFLCIASMYILHIIFHTAPVSDKVLVVDGFMSIFYDPITSIIVCRFTLTLREFENAISSTTIPEVVSQLRDHTASTVLKFSAQPSDNVPVIIASFTHPVHVYPLDLSESKIDTDAIGEGSQGYPPEHDITAPVPDREMVSGRTQPSTEEHYQ